MRDMTHVEWEYWEADLVPGGFWARMAPDAVIALEAAAAGARASAKSFFRNERTGVALHGHVKRLVEGLVETLYEYDLDKMEQLNTETKFRRTIRLTPALRRSASVQASASPPVSCMEEYVGSAIRSASVVACVDCSEKLHSDEVLRWAQQGGDTEAAAFLDQRLLAEQLKDMPDFCWCAHGCGMGQEHCERERKPMACRKCRGKTCFRHKSVWHEGQTCDEYDASQQQAERDEILRAGVKPCPKCGEGIQKQEGCARMTCTCTHTFCWDCCAPYDGPQGIRLLGNDAHHCACPWHSDNLPSAPPANDLDHT